MVVVGGPKLGGNAGSECNIRGGMEGGGGGGVIIGDLIREDKVSTKYH